MLRCLVLPSLLVIATPFAPLACGSKQEARASFGANGATGAPAGCAPGQRCAPPPPAAASHAPTATGGDPNALAALLAGAAAAGLASFVPAAAVADAAEMGLRAAAARHAPGMTAEGQVARGNLIEGGHIGFVTNMEPSKCYTIVAFGAGVSDLDINLLAPPFYNFLTGQDAMSGDTAVIGASPRPICPVVPIAVPYKVDLYARRGGGAVAAQVYSKPK